MKEPDNIATDLNRVCGIFENLHFWHDRFGVEHGGGLAGVSWVYCFEDVDNREVKIGYSKHPAERMLRIEKETKRRLSVVWMFPGGVEVEREAHAFAKERRLYGEWFDFKEEEALWVLEHLVRNELKIQDRVWS